MKIYLLLLLMVLGKLSFSQVISKVDSNCIVISEKFFKAGNLLNETSSSLLFTIADKALRISYTNKSFYIYRGKIQFDFATQEYESVELDSMILRRSRKLKRCFNNEICRPRFYYLSDFKREGGMPTFDSNFIYFNLIKFGRKEFEYCYPVSYASLPNMANGFPMDKDIFHYLVALLNKDKKSNH